MVAIEEIHQKYLSSRSVTIDSRKVPLGSLFFAIRGPHFNGNAFAAQALSKGASYAIVDDPAYAESIAAYIIVEDSLATLEELARYHRAQYGMPVIAITGSYGKTTTKELVYRVLQTTYRTVATSGNLNTRIGVALTLLSIAQDTEIVVVEMGATQLGDIALCCSTAQPTHGLITAIGEAHLESFGHIEGIIQGKRELYDYLYDSGGVIFLNTLDPLLVTLSKPFIHPITYPQATDFITVDLIAQTPYLCYKSSEGKAINTYLLGKPHIYNIAAALCIGKYFQVPLAAAHKAIQTYKPTNKRMELVTQGSNQLILDSYNAAPVSVQAALEALLQLKVDYRIAILGDMAELGSQMVAWHTTIIAQLRHPGYDLVLLCGPYFRAAASLFPIQKVHAFADKKALEVYLWKQHFQYSGILIKGSRSLAMDTLLTAIK